MVAVKSIGVRELKSNPGKVLGMVRDSKEAIDATIRGEIVFRITPIRAKSTAEEHAEVWKRHEEVSLDISRNWPKGVTAEDAINDIRREL